MYQWLQEITRACRLQCTTTATVKESPKQAVAMMRAAGHPTAHCRAPLQDGRYEHRQGRALPQGSRRLAAYPSIRRDCSAESSKSSNGAVRQAVH